MKIDKKMYRKVQRYTSTDYEPFMRGDSDKLIVDSDGALAMIEDLLIELSLRDEQIEDLKEQLENGADDDYDYYGISRDDFF